MEEYLVSIIVPVYNAEKYLPAMLKSVERQSVGFERIQLILADDCSSDRSFRILTEFAAKHKNVTLLQTPAPSGSASMPRNLALNASTANYILFLDSDDILLPDAVEVLMSVMNEQPCDLADAAYAELRGQKPGAAHSRYNGCREGSYNIRSDMDEWFPISHPIFTKLLKRSVIEEHRIRFDSSLRNGEDSVFLYRYMRHITFARHTNRVVYGYRVREDSVSHNHEKRFFVTILDTFKTMRQDLMGTDLYGMYDRFLESISSSYLDILCDSTHISDGDCEEILSLWFPFMQYVGENCLNTDTAIAAILADDAKKNDFEAFCFHFFALRPLYLNRRRQLEEIFDSKGYKLIAAVNRLLGR